MSVAICQILDGVIFRNYRMTFTISATGQMKMRNLSVGVSISAASVGL